MFNILIVEDDKNTRKLMYAVLKNNGYTPLLAEDGVKALEVIDTEHIDLMIVDIMMPNMNGYELIAQLREMNFNVPVLMVTAKATLNDKKKGFLVGIDDYMVKPIEEEEMLLRIKALLRRYKIVSEHKIIIGKATIDYVSLTVKREEKELSLPKKEFYLLYKLLSYPDVIFTRFQLMEEIWGMDSDTDENTVNVHINRLRNRFKDFPEFEIITVRGLGYKAVRKNEK